MDIVSGIIALLQAIPSLKDLFEKVSLAWAAHELEAHNDDFAKAHLELIKNHNQILLEQAMGSINAGKPGMDGDGLGERPVGGGETP